jgi:hypothetical protein
MCCRFAGWFSVDSCFLSNHPNDKQEAEPTLRALPVELGKPNAATLDNGFFSEANINLLDGLGIEPYIATGREALSSTMIYTARCITSLHISGEGS